MFKFYSFYILIIAVRERGGINGCIFVCVDVFDFSTERLKSYSYLESLACHFSVRKAQTVFSSLYKSRVRWYRVL